MDIRSVVRTIQEPLNPLGNPFIDDADGLDEGPRKEAMYKEFGLLRLLDRGVPEAVTGDVAPIQVVEFGQVAAQP